jgi:hypothetical protein
VVDAQRKRIARELLADVRRLDRQVAAATSAVRKSVAASGTTLTQIYGVGPVLAAKILGHTGNVTRFPGRDHYASYTGAAPIEASSGDLRRHRLNRAGNRQLNCALHIIAVCQIRVPGPGQVDYQRKLAEAKTPAEARRSLIGGVSGARPAQESGRARGAGQGTAPLSCHLTMASLSSAAPGRAEPKTGFRTSPQRGPSIRHRRHGLGPVSRAAGLPRAGAPIDVCWLGLGQHRP